MAKGNRGGRGKTTVGSYKDGANINGEVIEFDGDLKLTKNDSSINKVQRAVLDTWEQKRANMKVEYANAFGFKGSEYGELKGGKNGVNLPPYYFANKGSVTTHIHPRGNGGLGGTFSDADITAWSHGNGTTIRAVAKEGTYSISKGKNFNGYGLRTYVQTQFNLYTRKLNGEKRKLQSKVNNGTMTVTQANKTLQKEFNSVLVAMHNDLLNHQSVYGYNYYLEKR